MVAMGIGFRSLYLEAGKVKAVVPEMEEDKLKYPQH
jgi:hypothetical protein